MKHRTLGYMLPPIPKELEGLEELALDLRWATGHASDAIWDRLDHELWETTRNPWLILQTIAATRLKELAADPSFVALVQEHVASYHEAMQKSTSWFESQGPDGTITTAYFCMEFGLSEALPIYSGGLGILAGDYLKTSSDLGVPAVGVGLLYQQGYFRQAIDANGQQHEYYPFNDPGQLPIMPAREKNGEWAMVNVEFPGRTVWLRAWKAIVGRVTLYLLDSNVPLNSPADRGITSELYGGGTETRIQQEILLGIGGWRLLRKLGIVPDVCHLNEGHAAFVVLERARDWMAEHGKPFDVALTATRAGNVFTTHTPVPAGFDLFSPELMRLYLGHYIQKLGIDDEHLLALGRKNPADPNEPFNMAYLAIRGSGIINGVSRLHGEVSRRLFQPLFPRWPQYEVPVTHVTNGVHVPTWESSDADSEWEAACGKDRWGGDLAHIEEALRNLPAETIWELRNKGRRRLVLYVRKRLAQQREAQGTSAAYVQQARGILDPNALTIGFARRFAEYKRPTLLLHDPERLIRLLANDDRPVQLIIAGKAHPRDDVGKALVKQWFDFIKRPDVPHKVVFLADYDIALAQQLVQGVDLWLNNPRRPMEASGTSGMKVLVNGGLNCSELDGWWAEAYNPKVGWAIGDGKEHGDDPAWDAHEAEQLYDLLEKEIVPMFYDRDDYGIPRQWVEMMRESMATLTGRFSTNRMVREYVEKLYFPASQTYRKRTEKDGALAEQLHRWSQSVAAMWEQLHFGKLASQQSDGKLRFQIQVYFGEMPPDFVSVQLYADPLDGSEPEIYPMAKGAELPGSIGGFLYTVEIETERPVEHYTPRIVPFNPDAKVPLENHLILWYK